MDQKIIDFINDNEELIENSKWEEIYQKASDDLNYDTGKFTEVILSADIHPEDYLKDLPDFFLCKSTVEEFTIPNNTTSIGNHAFYNSPLTSITIPDSLTNIGDYAFYNCHKLINIAIPNSVTTIGKSTFVGCIKLTNVKIPDNITSISDSAFAFCDNLTSVTIPNNVTSIGYYAFRECTRLTSVTIPNSVTWIGDYAFTYCGGDNLIIYYQGSKEDWKKIYNSRSFEYTYYTCHCVDGDVVKRRG